VSHAGRKGLIRQEIILNFCDFNGLATLRGFELIGKSEASVSKIVRNSDLTKLYEIAS
jgi:hypothetical protein